MHFDIEELVRVYLRELSEKRLMVAAIIFVTASVTMLLAVTMPKSYTSSASIYPDNSNILRPLMEGNAVTTGIVDQARLARAILFNRDFIDPILEAGGYDVNSLSLSQKDEFILDIHDDTYIENIGRNPVSLIRISHTNADPIRAFSITQRYTSLFLEQSIVSKKEESRSAFNFIQNQVNSYQSKLQQSEGRLSKFKSENNFGTLINSNNRIASYRSNMERLQLELLQLDTQISSVESQLAGETTISRDLSQVNTVRVRINNLQIVMDSLRSRFYDDYPDVVNMRAQIEDLQRMLDTGEISVIIIEPNDTDEGTMTPLHQQLRSRLAALKTEKQAKISQSYGLSSLLTAQETRAVLINEKEAELAEYTRDYNVTQDFYNGMLRRLENARVSVQLDEEEQGVTFKVQESAVIPTSPDGVSLTQMLIASFAFSLLVPGGLLVLYIELDTRIRSEAGWSSDWPPLIATVPPMLFVGKRKLSMGIFFTAVVLLLVALYSFVGALNYMDYL